MHFTIWLTEECNLQCNYCYEGKDKKHSKMSLETAEKVVKFIYGQITSKKITGSYISVDFLGGEPLLNYEVMCYIIEKIKLWELPLSVFMSVTTNAILLTKEKIEYLTNSLNEISISIDGTEKTHDMYRKFENGEGSYKYIIKNVQEIISRQQFCMLRARMTVCPDTAKWLYENVDFLVNMGFKTIVPVMDRFVEWSGEATESLYQEMVKIYKKIVEKRKDLRIGLVEDVAYRQETFCLAGDVTMHISPEGKIFPCSYVMGKDAFLIGDVQEGIIREKVEWLKEINNSQMNNSCMLCEWKKFCNGNRCRLLNYVTTGDFFCPSSATCANERLQLKLCAQYYKVK